MGLIYTENKEKQLYTAYGMTVYGTENKYDWTIYPDKPTETVYTALRIEKNGEDIVNVVVGNRCIFEKVFLRTIDNFLYWIDKDDPDSYTIENAVFKSLCVANSLFNYNIENRKRQGQKDLEYEARREAIIAEEERKLGEIRDYCKKKNLVFKKYYEKIYLVKIIDENVREMITDADKEKLEWLVDFMHKHPNNEQAIIVIEGELEEVIEEIGWR